MADIDDHRRALIHHYDRIAKARYTGVLGAGHKVDDMPFLELCCDTLKEMIEWNEPITWDDYRDLVLQRHVRKD